MKSWLIVGCIVLALAGSSRAQSLLALSFDDPNTKSSPTMAWQERNQKLLMTLAQHEIHAVLYVCGMRVNSPEGQSLLQSWDAAGHNLGNHSFTHPYFHSSKVSAKALQAEVLKTDSMIGRFAHSIKLFRFPYLKEGNTLEKRDSMRTFLAALGYQNGAVSIDASDWYYDQRLCDSLQKNPLLNPMPYREAYVAHILDRAAYYDSLAIQVTGHRVRHVLLLHHNLINAMFLDDVIRALHAAGYVFVDADLAYKDAVYQQQPAVVPAGESLIWSLAKASGKFEDVLRYPAEDGEYEAAGLDLVLRGR
jgi:peptidoglycan-N-acetylglucosamine deacetylase